MRPGSIIRKLLFTEPRMNTNFRYNDSLLLSEIWAAKDCNLQARLYHVYTLLFDFIFSVLTLSYYNAKSEIIFVQAVVLMSNDLFRLKTRFVSNLFWIFIVPFYRADSITAVSLKFCFSPTHKCIILSKLYLNFIKNK